jgi:hypothetical protein
MGGKYLMQAWRFVKPGGKILDIAGDLFAARPAADACQDTEPASFASRKNPTALRLIRMLAGRGLVAPLCDPGDAFARESAKDALDRLANHLCCQMIPMFIQP